jgi:hypothetical protein
VAPLNTIPYTRFTEWLIKKKKKKLPSLILCLIFTDRKILDPQYRANENRKILVGVHFATFIDWSDIFPTTKLFTSRIIYVTGDFLYAYTSSKLKRKIPEKEYLYRETVARANASLIVYVCEGRL